MPLYHRYTTLPMVMGHAANKLGIMLLGWPKWYKPYPAGSQYYVTVHCLSLFLPNVWFVNILNFVYLSNRIFWVIGIVVIRTYYAGWFSKTQVKSDF